MFEAQEDQSETSQQTSASDDEKGPESQVLYQPQARRNVSWPSGNSLGNFHQLQLIGDSTYDYSEWDIGCVSFPLFKWIWDSGNFLKRQSCLYSCFILMADREMTNKELVILNSERDRDGSHAHLTP